MINSGQWFKLFSTTLINRRSNDKTSKDEKSTNPKCKITTSSEKVNSSNLKSIGLPNPIVTSIINLLSICVVSILFISLFHLIPWENWIFSENGLARLTTKDNLEYKNYLATSEQQIDEIR